MDQAISSDILQRRRRGKLLLALGLLAAVVVAIWGVNRLVRPSLARDDIRVSVVRRGEIANTISASGVVIPVHEEQVASPIDTRVSAVHVKAGQEVAAGELLLELDDHTIRLAIDSLEEQIAQQTIKMQSLTLDMQQKHKQLASEIELLELDLQSAKVKLQRYRQLSATGVFPAADLAAAELAVKRYQIELRQRREAVADTRRSTETSIAGARLQESILRKSLDQQRQLQARTRVRAPIAGMLTWVSTDAGASVIGGQMVAKVSELHNYRVEATVSDFYARYLNPGQPVRVVYSGQTLAGEVQTILPEIKDGTVSLLVRLNEPNNPLLRNKLRVDANILTEQKTDALIVDSGPAFNGRGEQEVFVIAGNQATRKRVELGLGDGTAVEIVAGANVGDTLIVSDTALFEHLSSIRVVE